MLVTSSSLSSLVMGAQNLCSLYRQHACWRANSLSLYDLANGPFNSPHQSFRVMVGGYVACTDHTCALSSLFILYHIVTNLSGSVMVINFADISL